MMKTKDDFNDATEWKKYLGNYGEKKFSEQCADRNILFIPVHDQQYDGIIELKGKLKKVQIKAISFNKNSGQYLCLSARKYQRKYEANDFDYLALYVANYDKFYLIPATTDFIDVYNEKKISFYDLDFRLKPTQGSPINITKYKNW